MAKLDIKEFIEVNGVDAINTLGQLRQAIALLKEEMKDLQIGSDEYNEKARDLYAVQNKLSDAMYASKKPVDMVKGSMNELQAKLRELKEDWKNLAPDTDAFKAKTDEVNAVKAQINALNEGIGNFQHNVGNYSNSIIEAFDKMGLSVKGLSGMFSALGVNVGDTSKVMGALLKVFQMFSPTLKNLTTGMKGVETATAGATTAMKGLKVAIASTGIGLLVVAISSLIANWDKISRLWKADDSTLKNLNEEIKNLSINVNLANEKIEYNVRLMQAQGKSAEEVIHYRIVETEKIYAEALAEQIYAQSALESAKARGVSKKSIEEYTKALEEATKITEEADKQRQKAYQDKTVQQAIEERTKAEKARAEATRKRAEAEKFEADTLNSIQAEIDKAVEASGSKLDAERTKAEEVQKSIIDGLKTEREKEAESYAERLALLKQWGLDTTALEEEHKNNLIKFRQEEAQASIAALLAQVEAEEELRQRRSERDIAKAEDPENGVDIETQMALYDADFEAYAAYIERKIELNNQLLENYDENSEEYKEILREQDQLQQDLLDAEEKRDEKRKKQYQKLMKARQEATKSFVNGTSNLFKALSQAMGENTKAGKAFAIASATIDTIASALAGFRAGYNQWKDMPGPMAAMAPIQGAINATVALVSGYAQVQKIQSVDTSGSSTSTGATATAVAIPNISGLSTPYEYTREVTTETEREEMNRDQRVYILESDIQDSNRRVQVRENETTF